MERTRGVQTAPAWLETHSLMGEDTNISDNPTATDLYTTHRNDNLEIRPTAVR